MATLGERDLYDVLGAPRDATPEALKHALRSRARSLHPDVSADPDADARFAELSQAYEVLSRPVARLLYDRFGYVTTAGTGFEESPPVDADEVEDPPPGKPRRRTRPRARAPDASVWRIVDVPPDAAASEPSDVDAEVRERDPRLVRYAAAAGAVAAIALLVVLALAPDALAF
jgi:curved DNA-binding protein CbpA